MKYTFALLLLLFSLCSCGSRNAPPALEGLWTFHENSRFAGLEAECFLNLKKSGRYTLYIPDYYDYGYWRRSAKDSNLLVFTSKRHPRYYGDFFTMQFRKYAKGQLQVSYTLPAHRTKVFATDHGPDVIISDLDKEIVLERSEVQYPDTADPYAYKLNRWRIRPEGPEDCEAIRRRTVNYLEHMCALFEEQSRQQSPHYGYPHSPSPLLYGSNGIATIDFRDISPYWKQTFYNNSEARQGCAILYTLFDEKLDIPKGYKRPDEMWYKLLRQMAAYATQKDYCSAGHRPDTLAVR